MAHVAPLAHFRCVVARPNPLLMVMETVMTLIRFVHSDFPDPSYSRFALVERFIGNAKARKARRMGRKLKLGPDGRVDQRASKKVLDEFELAQAQYVHIRHRAQKIAKAHEDSSPFVNLKNEQRDQLMRLRHGVKVIPIPSDHRADEIAAILQHEYPWMKVADNLVWQDMRCSVQRQDPGLHCRPILLNGPPGTGKTSWSRRFAELVGIPSVALDASGESAGFSVTGLQKGWGSATLGRPLSLILGKLVANPIIIIDEIKKPAAPVRAIRQRRI